MARYVVHLIKTELDVEPNSGVGGVYEQVLKVLIAAVKHTHEDPYVHDLMRAALGKTLEAENAKLKSSKRPWPQWGRVSA